MDVGKLLGSLCCPCRRTKSVQSTTGSALAFGEILTGPLFKRGGKTKLQMILSIAGLNIFCGVMSMSNEHRQDQAIAVSTKFLLRFRVDTNS